MEKRVYNHQYYDGEILIPDKRSLKAGYGSLCPEAYSPNDDRFLKEVRVEINNMRVPGYIVSPPSEGYVDDRGDRHGKGMSIVEVQQSDGGFTEMGVNESHLWRRLTNERKNNK